jgi:hypothetical protein
MITKEMHDRVYAGLAERGFGPLNGEECSRGGCHTPDEKHYILSTDGMLIYSSTPDCYQPGPDTVIKEWFFDEFDFSELDAIMKREGK